MKLSFITPTRYIKGFGDQSDFILALSHLIQLDKVNAYEANIVATRLPIILDNGLFENHKPEKVTQVIMKAVKIGAQYFFAPDELYKPIETQQGLEQAISVRDQVWKQTGKRIKIAAVVQADNEKDYIEQLLAFNENPQVELIGLSILSIPKSFEKQLGKYDVTQSRIYLLEEMIRLNVEEGVKWKPCHMLGLGDSFEDVIFAKEHCPWVISNDTSSVFQTTLFKREYDENLSVVGGKVQEKVDFDLPYQDEDFEIKLQNNINLIKSKICK